MGIESRRKSLSKRLPGVRLRLCAVLILVLVAAVFTAGAVTASSDESSLTGRLFSFLGFHPAVDEPAG